MNNEDLNHVIGYNSIHQMINEALPKFQIICGSILFLLGEFLNVIFFSKKAIIMLLIIMLIDWISGTIKALKKKEFESKKFQRMIYKIFIAFFLIGCTYQLSEIFTIIGYVYLDSIIYVMYFLTYLSSVIENGIELEIIDKRIGDKILGLFNLDEILKRYLKK